MLDLKEPPLTKKASSRYYLAKSIAWLYNTSYNSNYLVSLINFLVKGGSFRSSIYQGSHLYDDLETLATGAEEMKQLGKILRLNQEIKTNATDLIGQVANIEEAIIRRAKQLKSQLGRRGINKQNFKGDPEVKKIIFNKKLTEPIDKGGYRIDIEKFMTNPVYADNVIALYDKIKQSYNPLRVLKTVPHYKGYSESLFSAYKGLKNKSVKFKVVVNKSRTFFEEYGVVNAKLREQVVKNTEKAVDLYMRQSWMRSYIKPITIPRSGTKTYEDPVTNKKVTKQVTTYAFVDSGVKARVLNYDTEIQLGTELGDANYKLWMETQVIPQLKELYSNNIFLKGLQPVVNTNTNLGSVSVNYGLPINMMPKTDYERDMFNDYKEAFNQLITAPAYTDGAGKALSVQDMFYYYSLIANGGRVGPTSIHGIFEDYINREGVGDKFNAPKNYRSFISKEDASGKTYDKILKYLTDEMLAPFSSPYTTGTNILRYKDKDTDKIELYIKPKQVSETTDEQDYAYNQMDEMMGYDMIMSNYHDSKQEINGFVRKTKEANLHNSDNRNYFQNPLPINGLSKSQVITLNQEEQEQYPTLARFTVTLSPVSTKKGYKAGLLDITATKAEDKEIAKKFIDYIRKDKGFLVAATTVDENGISNTIPVKEWLNGALETIENNCI